MAGVDVVTRDLIGDNREWTRLSDVGVGHGVTVVPVLMTQLIVVHCIVVCLHSKMCYASIILGCSVLRLTVQ